MLLLLLLLSLLSRLLPLSSRSSSPGRITANRVTRPRPRPPSPCEPRKGLERTLQPFPHVDRRLVSEELARSAHVRQRVAHVSGRRGLVGCVQACPRELADRPQELIERRSLSASDVDDFAAQPTRGRRREQVCLDDIVDVAEIPCLLAVAVDDGALLADGRRDEL